MGKMTMKFSSAVDSRGRVTLPKEIRRRLGLSAEDRVEFAVANGQIRLRPLRSDPNPFERYVGILGKFPGGEKGMKRWLRSVRGG
jgi:AbrB family looped-hinge helix DNA binding protein